MARPDRAGVVPEGASSDASTAITTRDDLPALTSLGGTTRAVIAVIGPASLLTALLYYFGWAYAEAQANYFAMDQSVLDFSAQDYLLRSVGAMFLPLAAAFVLALLWLRAHGWVSRLAERHRSAPLRRIKIALLVMATLAFVVGLIGGLVQTGHLTRFAGGRFAADLVFLTPLALGAAVALGAYGRHVAELRPAAPRSGEATSRVLARTLVMLLLTLTAFWAVGNYASAVGRGNAQRFAASLAGRPEVIVYSKHPLPLDVVPARVRGRDTVFRYRYGDLRLLFRSGGKYFLVPRNWWDRPLTLVLPESWDIQLEFQGPPAG